MCGFCVQNKEDEWRIDEFNSIDYERIINGIYEKSITPKNLDIHTYVKTANKLSEGVYKGFGKNIESVLYATPDHIMLNALRENVYVFSAAKTYQQTREVSSLLTKDGAIASFGDFKKQAKEILVKYNENYLRAEYNSAIAQSTSASQWQTIQAEKEVLPMLTYSTVGDGRVRPEHAMLDRITRHVDDKFWDLYYPPNGWNCRCDVMQSDTAEKTNLKGFTKPKTVPDIFLFNSGKDKIVFSKQHPYFDVAPRDIEFAKLNFNLPLPKDGI